MSITWLTLGAQVIIIALLTWSIVLLRSVRMLICIHHDSVAEELSRLVPTRATFKGVEVNLPPDMNPNRGVRYASPEAQVASNR